MLIFGKYITLRTKLSISWDIFLSIRNCSILVTISTWTSRSIIIIFLVDWKPVRNFWNYRLKHVIYLIKQIFINIINWPHIDELATHILNIVKQYQGGMRLLLKRRHQMRQIPTTKKRKRKRKEIHLIWGSLYCA